MSATNISAPRLTDAKHHGPHPGILAIVYTGLFLVSLALFNFLFHGAEHPRPFAPINSVQKLFLDYPDAVRINSLLVLGTAIPLGLFTAAVTSRLRFLGVTATGVSIAGFGGTAAAILVIMSGLSTWLLSQQSIASDLSLMHALHLFSFVSGGYAYTACLGLLMAGISVPCLFGGYAPKWLAWLGLILAGLSQLSILGLVIPDLVWILPLVRFPSYVWMIGIGFTLAKSRPDNAITQVA